MICIAPRSGTESGRKSQPKCVWHWPTVRS